MLKSSSHCQTLVTFYDHRNYFYRVMYFKFCCIFGDYMMESHTMSDDSSKSDTEMGEMRLYHDMIENYIDFIRSYVTVC